MADCKGDRVSAQLTQFDRGHFWRALRAVNGLVGREPVAALVRSNSPAQATKFRGADRPAHSKESQVCLIAAF
jgi:hypothetical protein